jgi:sec-independent protein translocase protein TatB
VFNNLNMWEIGVLLLLALFIFGPDRLPKVISDGMRLLRNLRAMARNATEDLSRELGTDVKLEDLHPKTFIRKHLLSEDEEKELRKPFEDIYRDVRSTAEPIQRDLRQAAADANDYTKSLKQDASPSPSAAATPVAPVAPPPAAPPAQRYDADAT